MVHNPFMVNSSRRKEDCELRKSILVGPLIQMEGEVSPCINKKVYGIVRVSKEIMRKKVQFQGEMKI